MTEHTYKIDTGKETYTIEAEEIVVSGDYIELFKGGYVVAVFFHPVSVIKIK